MIVKVQHFSDPIEPVLRKEERALTYPCFSHMSPSIHNQFQITAMIGSHGAIKCGQLNLHLTDAEVKAIEGGCCIIMTLQ